jgi:hypothetical protein
MGKKLLVRPNPTFPPWRKNNLAYYIQETFQLGLEIRLRKTGFFLNENYFFGNLGSDPCSKDARWFENKPKIPIWVNFGGPCNGQCWNMLCPFRLFDGHLLYLTAICYILWSFVIFSPRFGMLYQ